MGGGGRSARHGGGRLGRRQSDHDSFRSPFRVRPHFRGVGRCRRRRRSRHCGQHSGRPADHRNFDRARLSCPACRARGRHRHARDADHARAGEGRSQRRQNCRDRTRSDPAEGALFHPRARSLGRGAPVAPHRSLRLSPRRASAICRLAPFAAGAARETRTIAGAGGGHADRCRGRRHGAARRRRPQDLERARAMLAPGKHT